MSDKIIYVDSEHVKKLLTNVRNEIEEYVEYLVGVEGVEMSDHQQKKMIEPIDFEIVKLELDKYTVRHKEVNKE